MVQLRDKLNEAFHRELSIADLFKLRTIHALARRLGGPGEEAPLGKAGTERARSRGRRTGKIRRRKEARLKHRKR